MTLATKTSEVNFVKQGKQGDKGAKLRMRDWSSNVSYLCGSQGEDFYDVVVYNTKLYLCIKSHTSSTSNNPQTSVANNLGYWALATDWQFVATKLLLAEKITADQIDADGITAKDVDISGKITATSGTIGGFEINEHYLGNIDNIQDGECGLRIEKSSFTMLKTVGGAFNSFQVTPNGNKIVDIYVAASDSQRGVMALVTSGILDLKLKDNTEYIRIGNSIKVDYQNILIYGGTLSVRQGSTDYQAIDGEWSFTYPSGASLGVRNLKFVKGILVSAS